MSDICSNVQRPGQWYIPQLTWPSTGKKLVSRKIARISVFWNIINRLCYGCNRTLRRSFLF